MQRGDTLFVHANLEALGRVSLANGDGANGLVPDGAARGRRATGTLVRRHTLFPSAAGGLRPLETPTAGPWSPSASLLRSSGGYPAPSGRSIRSTR